MEYLTREAMDNNMMWDTEQTKRKRTQQIKELFEASTPDERLRIKQGQRDGRRLRMEVEKLLAKAKLK